MRLFAIDLFKSSFVLATWSGYKISEEKKMSNKMSDLLNLI